MEAEGERFGAATGLDSRVDLRVHRRGLRPLLHGDEHAHPGRARRDRARLPRCAFTNPDDPRECFTSTSLIEAMVLLARARRRGCRGPSACRAALSGLEVRINATNAGAAAARRRHDPQLVAAAPGRDPLRPGHRRAQPRHRLVRLLQPGRRLRLEHRAGAHRRRARAARTTSAWRRSCAASSCAATTSRPTCAVHYGLVQWFLGTRRDGRADHALHAVVPRGGRRARSSSSSDVDLELAFDGARATRSATPRRARVLARKETLLMRPLAAPAREPARARRLPRPLRRRALARRGRARRASPRNPVALPRASSTTSSTWRTRPEQAAVGEDLGSRPGDPRARRSPSTPRSSAAPARRAAPSSRRCSRASRRRRCAAATTRSGARCLAAHRGFQLGLELLLLMPRIGAALGLPRGRASTRSCAPSFPERFTETRAQAPSSRARSRRRRPPAPTRS